MVESRILYTQLYSTSVERREPPIPYKAVFSNSNTIYFSRTLRPTRHWFCVCVLSKVVCVNL